MPNLNKVIIIGHLGRDPEVRYTQDGKPVANFSVAVTEKYNGNEKTEWFSVVAFSKTAEIVQKYLHKGNPAYVEGKLQTREWNDKDGQKRTTTEIVASNIVFIGSKQERKDDGFGPERYQQPDAGITDSDIPF